MGNKQAEYLFYSFCLTLKVKKKCYVTQYNYFDFESKINHSMGWKRELQYNNKIETTRDQQQIQNTEHTREKKSNA